MAYDRYDTRDGPRGERSRWSGDRDDNGDRGGREDRGFFERAGDQIASWFGDDDHGEHRRSQGQREGGWSSREGEPHRGGGWSGGQDRQREQGWRGRDQESGRHGWDRGSSHDHDRREGSWAETRGDTDRGGRSERDYNPSWRRELWGGGDQDRGREYGRREQYDRDRDSGYRPMTGDYGRSEQFSGSGGGGSRGYRESRDQDQRFERDRSQSEWGRDPYRQTSRSGTQDWSDRSRHEDPHYSSWRQRHMGELDRDYEEFRREHQSRFEDDFAGWREKRQQKRGLLGQIREHMEVVGNDEKHVGTVDKAAGDRIILTKSDTESGGAHHSLSCSDIDRVEGERVILDCSAEQAKQRWRDESRNRALFEREDQGEIGPRMLDRSFEGTYRR